MEIDAYYILWESDSKWCSSQLYNHRERAFCYHFYIGVIWKLSSQVQAGCTCIRITRLWSIYWLKNILSHGSYNWCYSCISKFSPLSSLFLLKSYRCLCILLDIGQVVTLLFQTIETTTLSEDFVISTWCEKICMWNDLGLIWEWFWKI